MVIWFLNVKLTMVAWFNLTIWPWSTMVQPWSKHCQTMVDHGSAMFIPQRHINLNVSSRQVIYLTWLTIRSLMICECGTDYGQTMVKTLPDHGWPWFGHVHPPEVCWFECLSTSRIWPHVIDLMVIWFLNMELTMVAWYYLTMVNHGWPWFGHVHPPEVSVDLNTCIRYLTMIDLIIVIWFLNVELTMVDHGQTMVAWPWSTMVEPWSKHCQTMFTLQRYVDLNICTSSIWPWFKPCHLIFECGTDHGWPWSDHGCLTMVNHGRQWWPFNMTMVNHGSTMVKTLPDHGQPWSLTMVNHGHWPWSNHGSTMVDHGLTMFIPQG